MAADVVTDFLLGGRELVQEGKLPEENETGVLLTARA